MSRSSLCARKTAGEGGRRVEGGRKIHLHACGFTKPVSCECDSLSAGAAKSVKQRNATAGEKMPSTNATYPKVLSFRRAKAREFRREKSAAVRRGIIIMNDSTFFFALFHRRCPVRSGSCPSINSWYYAQGANIIIIYIYFTLLFVCLCVCVCTSWSIVPNDVNGSCSLRCIVCVCACLGVDRRFMGTRGHRLFVHEFRPTDPQKIKRVGHTDDIESGFGLLA